MNNTTQNKFIEDLLKEDKIDISALSSARFKHPVQHWVRVKYLITKDKVEEIIWKVINIFRS